MGKSRVEVEFLQHMNSQLLSNAESNVLSVECRMHNISSVSAVEILKYIFPRVRQTSKVPCVVVQWLADEHLTEQQQKEKYLRRLSKAERKKYSKYRIGREIKVRLRFRNESKAYQDIRLAEIYNQGLIKYLKQKGYDYETNSH